MAVPRVFLLTVMALAPISQVQAKPSPTSVEPDFVVTSSADFKMKIGMRLQSRFQYEALEGFGAANAAGEGTDDRAAFSIPRARLTLKGSAFRKELTYKFQAGFGKGLVMLKDFFANAVLVRGVQLRVGQMKRPFSRQQINSSSRLAFADRAITDEAFGAGRDMGCSLHNGIEKSPEFEWAVGVFNGATIKPSVSGTKLSNGVERLQPAVVARVGFNMGGIKGYSEGDLEGGPFRLSVGAGVMWLDSFDDEVSGLRGNVDFSLKVEGFALSGAFYAAMDSEPEDPAGLSLSGMGLHTQASWVLAEVVQPIVRFEWHEPEGLGGESPRTQVGLLGLNWFFYGHKLKWQTDAGLVMSNDGTVGGESRDLRMRTQLQFAF